MSGILQGCSKVSTEKLELGACSGLQKRLLYLFFCLPLQIVFDNDMKINMKIYNEKKKWD